MGEHGAGRGGRAAAVAAGALVTATVLSCRLAAANILLVVAGVATWLAWRRGELKGRPRARVLLPPLAAFALFSLISALDSLDPLVSVQELPRLLIFLVVPAAAALIDLEWWPRLIRGVAAATVILAFWGLAQYAGGADNLENRITGPLSHYMLYSGWLLLAVLLLVGEAVLGRGRRALFLLPAAALGTVAIILSFTRNAWVGLGVGLLLLAAVWRRRLLLLYPVLALLIWVVFPRAVIDRALSTLDLHQHANYDRLCMAVAGAKMVRDHPWTGVGPGMVPRLYPLYRVDDAPRWDVPHLHDNVVQVAAERGVPALLAYLWLVGAFVAGAWRALPRLEGERQAMVAAVLVAFVGITVAGFFEYNFWQAVIQYFTLPLLGAATGRIEEAVR